MILTAVAVGAALHWLAAMMVPFVLALFITLALGPLIQLQTERLRFPRLLAVGVTFVLGLFLLALLGTLVSSSVAQLAANAASYQSQVQVLIGRVLDFLPFEQMRVDVSQREALASLIPVGSVRGAMLTTANAIVGVLSQGVVVSIFLFLLLIGGAAERTAGPPVLAEIEQRVQRYLLAKTLISATTGVLVGSVLAILGIDLALVFGLFAFLLNFIPSVGSIIATLLPIPVVLMDPEVTFTVAVLAISIPASIQLVIGNVIDPMIMGESLDLNPVVILLALMFWGAIWGIVGMLLAVPITAVMRILLSRFEGTKPLAEILAGRLPAPGG